MSKPTVIVIDYGMGNLFSICRAIEFLDGNVKISSNPEEIISADRIILPGVGAFGKGIEGLVQRHCVEALHEYKQKNRPLLGICLGMQLLLTESYEWGHFRGLNFISGKVVRFPSPSEKDIQYKIPHVGWNALNFPDIIRSSIYWKNTILHETSPGDFGYFVHSFIAVPEFQSDVLAVTPYAGQKFCSVIQKDHIFGCQFHPEKSGKMGLNIYKQFLCL